MPDNAVYAWAAYIVTTALFAGYALLLVRRRGKVRGGSPERG